MKDCILIKNKEYKELKKLAEGKKPDYLKLEIDFDIKRLGIGRYIPVEKYKASSNLDFSESLYNQIRRIYFQMIDKVQKDVDEIISERENEEIEKLKKEIAKLKDAEGRVMEKWYDKGKESAIKDLKKECVNYGRWGLYEFIKSYNPS